jgi:hypothetical protein
MDRNRNKPAGKAVTDDASVTERLQRLARNEQQRTEDSGRADVFLRITRSC